MRLPCIGNPGVTVIMTDVSDLGKCILRSIFKRCIKEELSLSVICPRAFLSFRLTPAPYHSASTWSDLFPTMTIALLHVPCVITSR